MNNKDREDPKPDHGQGPPDGKGRPVEAGRPVKPHRSSAPDLAELYQGELTALLQAYPGTRIWRQDEGYWLLSESALLPSLQQKALFLTGIPYARGRIARAWGF